MNQSNDELRLPETFGEPNKVVKKSKPNFKSTKSNSSSGKQKITLLTSEDKNSFEILKTPNGGLTPTFSGLVYEGEGYIEDDFIIDNNYTSFSSQRLKEIVGPINIGIQESAKIPYSYVDFNPVLSKRRKVINRKLDLQKVRDEQDAAEFMGGKIKKETSASYLTAANNINQISANMIIGNSESSGKLSFYSINEFIETCKESANYVEYLPTSVQNDLYVDSYYSTYNLNDINGFRNY